MFSDQPWISPNRAAQMDGPSYLGPATFMKTLAAAVVTPSRVFLVGGATAVLLGLLRKELLFLTFDEEQAKAVGLPTALLQTVLLVFLALTVVVAIKVVGAVLVAALLVIPWASALQPRDSVGAREAFGREIQEPEPPLRRLPLDSGLFLAGEGAVHHRGRDAHLRKLGHLVLH